jgi:hypothetical protein
MKTIDSFVVRVTLESLVLVAVLALGAAALGGVRAALGVIAGGALAVVNFRWLAGRAAAAWRAPGAAAGGFMLSAGLRFAAIAAACAAAFVHGGVHPVALVVGLSVLPLALVAQGLRAAREQV